MADTQLHIRYDEKHDSYRSDEYQFVVDGAVLRSHMKATGVSVDTAYRQLLYTDTNRRRARSAINTVAWLPALPDPSYPEGSTIYLATNNEMYISKGLSWIPSGRIAMTRPQPVTGTTTKFPDPDDWWSPSWAEVMKTWDACQEAGYEPEEIGEILYDLIKELVLRKGSE